jgi:hypothetical protein
MSVKKIIQKSLINRHSTNKKNKKNVAKKYLIKKKCKRIKD